jgi:hypothetical protein
MTTTYQIRITKKDIKEGKRLTPHGDPINLAIRRQLRKDVFVGSFFIEIGSNWPPVNDNKIGKFIRDFDAGKRVKPFNFELVVTD